MSKNVLFIGPYRQGLDGWNRASREYIRALIQCDINLTIRPVYLGPGLSDPPIEFLEYEENRLDHYDVVIQNVLPHFLDYNADYGKNIALFYTESTGWCNVWTSRLSTMDEVWVPSAADAFNVQGSGLHHPQVQTVPIPLDIKKFSKSYECKSLKDIEDRQTFKFYFIGELIQRKCVDRLLQAFHIEFDRQEDVDIIIKTSRSGLNPDQVAKKFIEYSHGIKSILRLYASNDDYKDELVITAKLSDDDLNYVHSKSNCFVMPSMGESWSLPVADAMGFGNVPVVIGGTGPASIVGNCGFTVNSFLDHVLVTDPPLPDIYTAREMWHNYSIADLCKAMRQAYEYYKSGQRAKNDLCMERVFNFSYENVAERIKQLL